MYRYQIQYSVTDADSRVAQPLVLGITFVEKATVTASLLFIGQAPSLDNAQSQAVLLNTSGSVPNSAFTTAVASTYQGRLAAATGAYVQQLVGSLNASADTVAAINTLRLGLFSTVAQTDLTVLNVSINQSITAAANVNSSSLVQNIVYNVTLQVVVLTADMLLSVFVDVLNSTYARRRLLSSSQLVFPLPVLSSLPQESTEQFADCPTLPTMPDLSLQMQPGTALDLTQQHMRSKSNLNSNSNSKLISNLNSDLDSSLQQPHLPESTQAATHQEDMNELSAQHTADAKLLELRRMLASGSSTAFPLASLLQFKTELMLAAISSTSRCDSGGLRDQFYQGGSVPDAMSQLCGAATGQSQALDQALQSAASSSNNSVPLLQVS